MNTLKEALPDFLSKQSRIGNEISITGKWVAEEKSSFFRKSVFEEAYALVNYFNSTAGKHL